MTQKIWLLLAVAASVAWADGGDKARYHLFKPTPRDRMRPMSADRPDATESAYTVDAGHVQIEIEIARYIRDRSPEARDGTEVDGWGFFLTNFKIGLTNRVDLQLIFDTYLNAETEGPAPSDNEGFGDLTMRVKINLWGNDRGDTAFALLPYVKFPTNQDDLGNDAVEGGLVLPFGTELPRGWGFGAQLEFAYVRNRDDNGYDFEFSQTASVGHGIAGDLSGFLEIASTIPGSGGWVGRFNAGLTYLVNDDVQVDGGAFLGLSRAADDLTLFVGVTLRF